MSNPKPCRVPKFASVPSAPTFAKEYAATGCECWSRDSWEMRIDISLLPALAAAFMLVFARVGAMVMLLPGLGEANIPVRIRLAIALLLTLIILPLHRSAYHIDMNSLPSLLVLMLYEIIVGVVLGATARVTLAALQVAGSVIAQ